jgi:hypothetical protein
MLYSRFVSYGNGSPKATTYYVDNLVFYRQVYDVGQSLTMEYLGGGTIDQCYSKHIQVSGVREGLDGWPDMVAGDMTQALSYSVEPGSYTRVCTVPSELWCVKAQGGDDIDTPPMQSVALDQSESFVLEEGMKAFVIHGSVTVNGTTHQGPKVLKASGDRPLMAATPRAYLFVWAAP